MHEEIDKVIDTLEKRGVTTESDESNMTGLGDLVESVLQSMGITEERFQAWMGIDDCNCSKRKRWLNSLWSWRNNAD